MENFNWLHLFYFAILPVYLLVFGYFVWQRRWTWTALGVGVLNLVLAFIPSVAPFRGALDPNYAQFVYGLIQVPPGFGVTLVAGTITLAGLAAACFAVYYQSGKPMLFVAIVDALLWLNLALPTVMDVLKNGPDSAIIQLGEYLTIPGLVAVLIILLFLLPLGLSAYWAMKRISPDDPAVVPTPVSA